MFDRRYRNAEGADQLELFKTEEAKPSVFQRAAPFFAIATVALAISLLTTCTARPEEAGKLVYVTSALLCDSEDLLKAQVDYITKAEKTGGSATGNEVDGCALVIDPGPATVKRVGSYSNGMIEVIIASFAFGDKPLKYGYVAVRSVHKDKGA